MEEVGDVGEDGEGEEEEQDAEEGVSERGEVVLGELVDVGVVVGEEVVVEAGPESSHGR